MRPRWVSDNHFNSIATPEGAGETGNDGAVRKGKAAPQNLRPASRRVAEALQGRDAKRQPHVPAFRHTPVALPPLGQALRQTQAVHGWRTERNILTPWA